MRRSLPLVLLLSLALGVASAIHAQITNPIQAPVVKRGLSVEVRDLVRLPETRGLELTDDVSASSARAAPRDSRRGP